MKAGKYAVYGILLLIFALSLYIRIAGFRFPYLRNIDSYVFYRYMDYVVQYGDLPEKDPLMLAPTGNPIDRHGYLYVYMGAYAYKIVSAFVDVPLWRFLVYFPAVIASLMAFPAFYIGKRLYDENAGLIAAFLMVFVPTIMARTLGGDPDSDAIVLFMSVTTLAFFVWSTTARRFRIFSSVATGLVLYLFSETWVGYWYVWWVMAGYTAAKAAYLLWKKGDWKRPVINFAIITLVFSAMNIIVYGLDGLSYTGYLVTAPVRTAGLFGEGGLKSEEGRQFPNVYVSVAEMQGSSLRQIVSGSGGNIFVPALAGLVYLLYSFIRKGKHFDSLVMMGIWFAGFLYASIMAVRFTIFLVMPVVFLASIALSKAWRIVEGERLEE